MQWQSQWRQGQWYPNQQWRPAAQRQQTQWRIDPEERLEQQEEVLENQQELRENAYGNQGPLRQTANGQWVSNSQSREVLLGSVNAPLPYVAAGGSTGGSTISLEIDDSYVPSSMTPNAYYRNGYQPWNPNLWD